MPSTPPGSDVAAPPEAARASALGVSAVVGATLAWTMGTLLVKGMDASSLWITFWRFVFALPLGAAFLFHGGRQRAMESFKRGWPAGVLFGLHVLVYFSAVRATSVAIVTFIAALQPVLVLLVAGPWLGEKVTRDVVGWSLTAVGGVALVVVGGSSGGDTSTFGNVLAVVNLFMWTAYFLLSKHLRRTVDVVPFQGTILLVSCAVVSPIVLLIGEDSGQVQGTGWIVIVLIMLVPSIGHLLVNWAHRYVDASVSSLVVLVVPVLAALGAALFLDEPFGPVQALGGLIVMASTGVVVHRSTRAANSVPPEDA